MVPLTLENKDSCLLKDQASDETEHETPPGLKKTQQDSNRFINPATV